MRIVSFVLAIIVATEALAAELPPPKHPLELRNGERIALLGGTFIERMQVQGYLETALTASHADRHLVFRNLGWSGDNVWGHSRAVFNAPDKGFERLIRDLKLAAPTLILVHYGDNEAHAGEQGLERFQSGLNRLLDELDKTTGARIVLLGPRKHENLGPPFPSQQVYNTQLERYIQAIETIAKERGAPFVDLNDVLPVDGTRPLTGNGLHLTPSGYQQLAQTLAKQVKPDRNLPADFFDSNHAEELRDAIIVKNELFFHRHRPQNETYLFLFRKHEQGNNAAEVPQFDPLIESKEREIAGLRKQQ